MKRPKLFKPKKEDVSRVMKILAQELSNEKVVSSSDFPDMKERGVREKNI